MLEQLQNHLLGVAEIGGNRLLGMDPPVLRQCAQLQGRIIAIELTDLDKTLYCHPGSWGLRLSLQSPPKEVDATIRGRTLGLISLSLQQDKMSTSMQERIEIIGNPNVARQFEAILAQLDPDWEEELSKITGDMIAFRIGEALRQARQTFRHTAGSLAGSAREYLQEESRQIPTLPEFKRFQQQVTDLRHDVERLEARLQHMLGRQQKNR